MDLKEAAEHAHDALLRAEEARQEARECEAEFHRRLNGERTDEEKVKILEDFAGKLAAEQIDLPPKFREVLNKCFWDLL